MKRWSPLLLLLALVLSSGGTRAGAQAAGEVEPEHPSSERVLTLRYWQAPSLLIPWLSNGEKDVEAASPGLEPLAGYRPDGSLVPRLAATIPSRANGGISADGATITWTLKQGVRWSDGTAMTAEDVVFTWKYCLAHGSGCQRRQVFDDVVSVQALDPHRVQIRFMQSKPYPYAVFTGSRMPIVSKRQFGDCLGVVARSCAQERLPLGTGPYRITSFTAAGNVAYVRNPFFHGEQPYFDRVDLKGGGTALDGARAVLEEETAEYSWNVQAEHQALQELEDQGLGRLAVAFGGYVERIYMNQTNPSPALGERRSSHDNGQNPHPFLTFPPIAQAMSMAIDRQMIVEQLYGFKGRPECNIVAAPSDYISTTNDACFIQDIDGANALLDSHGVVDDDQDGIRDYRGTPLRVTFQTTANTVREATQNLIRDWWQQIGISTDLIQRDAEIFFGGDPVLQKGETYHRFFADAQMFTRAVEVDPENFLFDVTCNAIPDHENKWTGGNISRACNSDYDTLFAQLRQTSPGPKRQQLVKQLNDLIVRNGYEIPLINRGIASAVANNLRGFEANPWDSQLWNIAQWSRLESSDRN